MSQPGQAQGWPVARHVRRHARRRKGWRGGAAGQLVAQPDDRPGQRRRRGSHAARRVAIERRADRPPATVDRSGRESDANLRAGARTLGGAARAPGACAAGGRLVRVEPSCRSPRRLVSREGARAAADAGVGCDVRQTRLPGHLGPAAAGRRAALVRCRYRARQARSAGRQAAGGRQEIRRALDLLLERSAAQRGRPDVLLGAERTKEHHRVADGVARRQQAVRPARGEAAQSRAAGRSRGLPDRRQLAGRDERGGDAVDAGLAE